MSGAFTGLLSWAPTSNRSITLPDDSVTLLGDDRPIGSQNYGVALRGYEPIVTVTATKTLAMSDCGTVQNCTNTAAATVTIPLNSTEPFPIGARMIIRRTTAQTVTVAWASGVTVLNALGATLTVTSVTSSTVIRKTDTDTWIAFPDLPESTIGGALRTAVDAPTAKATIGLANVTNVPLAEPRVSLQLGTNAGLSNTTGINWVAIGASAGRNATNSSWVAIGSNAALNNTSGNNWLAIGAGAAYSTTTASTFIAIGVNAGTINSSGVNWTAIGSSAGSNAIGSYWTAIGAQAGMDVTTGTGNTMIGYNTGRGITTGGGNTVIGTGVTGLAAALNNNVILASGDGAIKLQVDSTGLTSIASVIATSTTVSTSTTTGTIQTSGVGIGGGRGVFSVGTAYVDSTSASQINRSLYFNSGNIWTQRGDGSNVALTPLSLAAPVAVANVVTIPFDGITTVLNQYNVASPVTLTPASTRIQGVITMIVISADGTNIPALASGVRLFSDSATYNNVAGTLHVYTFYELSGTVWVRLSR